MEMEIDISLTLMSKDSIIELKDGIWETYALNSVASSSHFYFFPHHKENDISIIYKNSDTELRLAYKIFRNNEDDMNPEEWPFPS